MRVFRAAGRNSVMQRRWFCVLSLSFNRWLSLVFLNMYTYCHNNPLNKVDPYGHNTCDPCDPDCDPLPPPIQVYPIDCNSLYTNETVWLLITSPYLPPGHYNPYSRIRNAAEAMCEPLMMPRCVKWGAPYWRQWGFEGADGCANAIWSLALGTAGSAGLIGVGFLPWPILRGLPPYGAIGSAIGYAIGNEYAYQWCTTRECLQWEY